MKNHINCIKERIQGVSQKFPISAVRHKLGISEPWSRGVWGPIPKGPNGIRGKVPENFGYLTLKGSRIDLKRTFVL